MKTFLKVINKVLSSFIQIGGTWYTICHFYIPCGKISYHEVKSNIFTHFDSWFGMGTDL